MKKLILLAVAIAFFALIPLTAVGEDKSYEKGSVWSIALIKTKPNMQGEYFKNLEGAYLKAMQAAKDEGIIVSFKIIAGRSSSPDDWDVMLMMELENYAALDGLDEKFDKITERIMGGEDKRLGANIDRGEIRSVFGGKLMQEIIFE